MNLGRFVYKIDADIYYDSLRHKRIDSKAVIEYQLLAGQEADAIKQYLMAPKPIQKITLIPSYECNLRCKMCIIGHMLKAPTGSDYGSTDLNAFVRFMRRIGTNYCGIIGGEPFLHHRMISGIKQLMPESYLNITTNGIWDYEEVKEAIAACGVLTFSIDGLPEDHNAARIPLKMTKEKFGSDEFAVSLRNLAKVCKYHPDVNVAVQGSMMHADYDEHYIWVYFQTMIMLGVKLENISLSNAASSKFWNNNKINQHGIHKTTRKKPCCDFLLGGDYVVYNNKVYSSYYNLNQDHAIGDLDSSIDELNSNQMKYIRSSMPILSDPVCMTECKAVGICWGMCTNLTHDHVNSGTRLSDICGRATKEEAMAGIVANELSR